MFTKIFKSDSIYQLIFVAITAIIIWFHPFFNINTNLYTPQLSPLSSYIFKLFPTNNFFVLLLAFIVLFLQSLILKVAFSTNELINRNNLLPTFIYLLLMSSFADLYTLHPVLFANLFLIISLRYILGIYGKPDSFESVFNATLLISVASLFYFPAIYFIIFIWFSFIIYRLYTWREWVISLLGLCLPYLYLFSYYFMTDQLNAKIYTYFEYFKHNHLSDFVSDKGNYFFFGIVGLLSLFIVFDIINRLSEKTIYYRKKVLVLSMFLFISSISLIFSGKYFTYHLCLLFVPLSFFISTYIQQLKRLVVAEFIYILLIVAWLLNILF